MQRKILKEQKYLPVIILLLCAGTAFAYLNGNFKLSKFIASFSGGGTISSPDYEMQCSAGENLVGRTASGNYTMYGGFLGGAQASEEEPEVVPGDPYVYPNPYRPHSGGDYDAEFLTFANIADDVKEIKILNLAGEVVNTIKEAPAGGRIQWKPVNRAGRRLASGVYIYYILDRNGITDSGKFSIIH